MEITQPNWLFPIPSCCYLKWVKENYPIELSFAPTYKNLMKQKDTNAGIHTAYQILFQRAPRETELKIAGKFLSGKQDDTTAWTQYAHALLAGNEFQFID